MFFVLLITATHFVAVQLRTADFLIRETINVSVRTTEVTISSPSDATLRGKKVSDAQQAF